MNDLTVKANLAFSAPKLIPALLLAAALALYWFRPFSDSRSTPDASYTTAITPAGGNPYIFYWGTFQCRLEYDPGRERYTGALQLGLDTLRAAAVTAPFLWDGKALVKDLVFGLDGWPVESRQNQPAEADIAYYNKMSAWAVLLTPGERIEVTIPRLPDGKPALIDLQLSGQAPESPESAPAGFIWGKDIWLTAARYKAISAGECLQLLRALPGEVRQVPSGLHGHLAVYAGSGDISAAELDYASPAADSPMVFSRPLDSITALIRPGTRLVFEELAGQVRQKSAALEIVNERDARWHGAGNTCKLLWGQIGRVLGPAPNTNWVPRPEAALLPGATLEIVADTLSAASILDLLGQSPQLQDGKQKTPVQSMLVRYEEMGMSFTYTAQSGFPAYFQSLVKSNLKPGEHITVSAIEAAGASFTRLSLSLVAGDAH